MFTPGYGVDGYFLHNLQESGNAIIVGYNGNPSDDKKNEKFPHSISFTSDAIIQDDIVESQFFNEVKKSQINSIVDFIKEVEQEHDNYLEPDRIKIKFGQFIDGVCLI